ncbi:MAG: methionine adenosyltransferase [Bacteroidota bacterium]|jgi:S-adenosylmethionine synthetase
MKTKTFQFTSESVSNGHPDKVADQISDAILDAYLAQDPEAKVACECLITTGQLVIAGEVTSKVHVDAIAIARAVIKEIGYTDSATGFSESDAAYINLLHEQSPEINSSVIDGGAGDQGIMFGYACRETPALMPMPIMIAHQLMEKQREVRMQEDSVLLPDAKSQVTIRYENNIPVAIENIVLSTQHVKHISQAALSKFVTEQIIHPVINSYDLKGNPVIMINPSGSFTIGGPHGDTGLTGRKIIVDTYGGSCPHGGGAFSGKDPSKVDRSAAYAARYVAKHIVEAGLATRCTIQLSYAIGKAEPTSLYVNTHETGVIDESKIEEAIQSLFDLTPQGIIRTLGLKAPIYIGTAAYGHFGKANVPWEIIDAHVIGQLQLLK